VTTKELNGRFAQNHSKIDSKITQTDDGFSVRFSRNFEERSDDQRIKWLLRSKSLKNRFKNHSESALQEKPQGLLCSVRSLNRGLFSRKTLESVLSEDLPIKETYSCRVDF
jgi:hypothetical protein